MAEYKTVFCRATGEVTEKKSRFIATISHVETQEEASLFINEMRSKYWDARHNVYAYILKDGTKRYSDDGEPSGTSAMPSLNVLEGFELVDTAVVITRYFGGTLLGTGGLVRAYSQAVKLAVENAQIVTMCLCSCIDVVCDYSQLEKVKRAAEEMNAVIDDVTFEADVTVHISLKKENTLPLTDKLCEITDGRAKILIMGEKFTGIKCN